MEMGGRPPATAEPAAGPIVVELTEDVAGADEAWDELAVRTAAGPFLRPGWVRAWSDAFAPGELRLVVARRGNGLAGVAPVLIRGRLVASPANSHTPLYDFVAEDEAVAGALARWIAEPGRFARLHFEHLPADGLARPALARALREAGRPALAWAPRRAPYVALDGGYEAYMGTLSRGFRKELRRMERRLAEQGEVEIALDPGRDGLDAALDEGWRLEASGWKAEAGTAIATDRQSDALYRRVAAWAAERDMLRLAFLRVGGRAVAFDFCLRDDEALYALKGGFDTEYRRFGPGMLLTWRTLERAFGDELRTYELLGTDDEYKRRWTERTHERTKLMAFSRSPRGLAEYAAHRWARPLARRARRLAPTPRVTP